MGGGIGMGNTCKPMADSFQCMIKPTIILKKKRIKKKPSNYVKQEDQLSIIDFKNHNTICDF